MFNTGRRSLFKPAQASMLVKSKSLLQPAAMRFAATPTADESAKHKEEHIDEPMHHKFYEDAFMSTSIRELEFVRSPFYDLAKSHHAKEGEDSAEFITNMQLKVGMTQFISKHLQSDAPDNDTIAF